MKYFAIETIQAHVLSNITCDLCGSSCRISPNPEVYNPITNMLGEECFSYGHFSFHGAYAGKFDGEHVELDLCETCSMNLGFQGKATSTDPFYKLRSKNGKFDASLLCAHLELIEDEMTDYLQCEAKLWTREPDREEYQPKLTELANFWLSVLDIFERESAAKHWWITPTATLGWKNPRQCIVEMNFDAAKAALDKA